MGATRQANSLMQYGGASMVVLRRPSTLCKWRSDAASAASMRAHPCTHTRTRGVGHGRKSRRRGGGALSHDGRDSGGSDWRVGVRGVPRLGEKSQIPLVATGPATSLRFAAAFPLSSPMSLPFPVGAPVRSPVIPIASPSRRRTQSCMMRNGSRGRHCHTDTHRITRCCCLRPRASGRCCCCITARWRTQRLAVGRCRQS